MMTFCRNRIYNTITILYFSNTFILNMLYHCTIKLYYVGTEKNTECIFILQLSFQFSKSSDRE